MEKYIVDTEYITLYKVESKPIFSKKWFWDSLEAYKIKDIICRGSRVYDEVEVRYNCIGNFLNNRKIIEFPDDKSAELWFKLNY